MPIRLSDKTVALIATSLATFLTAFTGSSINIALPSLGRELSFHAVTLTWVSMAYILSANVFLLPMGKLGDLYGRTRIFTGGTIIFSLASLGGGLAPSAGVLLACRVLQGLGGGMLFGTGVAIISEFYPPEERGRALGINVASTYVGLSLGPPLGGFLTQNLGWRSVFFLSVLVGLSVFVLVFWKLRRRGAPETTGRFDYQGVLIWSASLVTTIYGLSRLPSLPGLVLILAGVIGFAWFFSSEGRKESPLVNPALFTRNRVFAFSSLAALLNYCATHGTGFLFSLYLQYIKGLPPKYAGLVMISQPVVMAIVSPFAGRLSDRVEPRIVATLGMVLTVAGLVISTFLHGDSPLFHIIACLVTLGLGFAFFSSPNTNAIMSSVEKKSYGVASAMVATMRLSGQTLSMAIVTVTFTLLLGRSAITPDNYPQFLKSLQTILVIFSVLCAAGVFASLIRGKVRQ